MSSNNDAALRGGVVVCASGDLTVRHGAAGARRKIGVMSVRLGQPIIVAVKTRPAPVLVRQKRGIVIEPGLFESEQPLRRYLNHRSACQSWRLNDVRRCGGLL